VTGALVGMLVPAMAWAAGSERFELVDEVARARPRLGFFGGLSAFCCLAVILVVVVVVVLVTRNRRRQ
jgi:hypothetical protein